MKECTLCKRNKEFSEFYKDKHLKSGLSSKCKTCTLSYLRKLKETNPIYKQRQKDNVRRYKLNNKERCILLMKRWSGNNKEYLKKYHREYSKKWASENKEKIKIYQENYKKKYPERIKILRRGYSKKWYHDNKNDIRFRLNGRMRKSNIRSLLAKKNKRS